MTLVVELLGPPRVTCDGRQVPSPRGRKAWAALAYLLLSDDAPSRSRLAALLCPDADDPLGALRWTLSELRRLLGPDASLGGDPVALVLPPDSAVDVRLLTGGGWREAVELPGLGRTLLDGVDVAAGAAFELWLVNARHRIDGAAEAVLREAALATIARDPAAAVAHASRLVEVGPLDEANHLVLIECLHAAGQHERAAQQAGRCTEILARELGVQPTTALSGALEPVPDDGFEAEDAPSIEALLEAGEAGVAVGALGPGLRSLWSATARARRQPGAPLLPRALLALGHALVHAGRCGDEQGAAILHEAAHRAAGAGDAGVAASAQRELAFADLQRGRYERAHRWVKASLGHDQAPENRAWVGALAGAAWSDQGRYVEAHRALEDAVACAEQVGSVEAEAFASAFLGRLHLLRRDLPAAQPTLERAVEATRRAWLALAPWPESLLAEVELELGDVDAAAHRLERSLALAVQVDDPCLESIAARGLGRVEAARGRRERAGRLLAEAPARSRRLPDSYRWIEAYALDAGARFALEAGDDVSALERATELERLAARCGMRELLARALLHRARLGDPAALDAATELATAIDNPALRAEVPAPVG